MYLAHEIAQVVEQLAVSLTKSQQTITTVESCTGGGIAYVLTERAGSSSYFNQGWVTYSNHAKQQLVAVPEDTLSQFGAVSEQTVRAMAQGALLKADANIAIAVSGVAGPTGGSADKPVGTVWFGWATKTQVVVERVLFSGDRHQVRQQAILHSLQQALRLVIAN